MRTEKITENPKSENPRSEISEKLICIILFIALRSVPVSSKDICIKKLSEYVHFLDSWLSDEQ